MKELSLDNGNTFVDFDNLEVEEIYKIDMFWDSLVLIMGQEKMEELNNLPIMQVLGIDTNYIEGKVAYIENFLEYVANEDIWL